jgi:hypothetical protein
VNADVASSHAAPVAERLYSLRRQQGSPETSVQRRSSAAGYQRRHSVKEQVSTGEALGARRSNAVEEAFPITGSGTWRRRHQGGGSGRSTEERRAAQRVRREGPGPMSIAVVQGEGGAR